MTKKKEKYIYYKSAPLREIIKKKQDLLKAMAETTDNLSEHQKHRRNLDALLLRIEAMRSREKGNWTSQPDSYTVRKESNKQRMRQ